MRRQFCFDIFIKIKHIELIDSPWHLCDRTWVKQNECISVDRDRDRRTDRSMDEMRGERLKIVIDFALKRCSEDSKNQFGVFISGRSSLFSWQGDDEVIHLHCLRAADWSPKYFCHVPQSLSMWDIPSALMFQFWKQTGNWNCSPSDDTEEILGEETRLGVLDCC